jgi:hypothetical protein
VQYNLHVVNVHVSFFAVSVSEVPMGLFLFFVLAIIVVDDHRHANLERATGRPLDLLRLIWAVA